jgi:hypothetical protein
MIPMNEALLLLRGWAERKAPLRVVFKSTASRFAGFCTVYDARDEVVAFSVGEDPRNVAEFLLTGCACEFMDVDPTEDPLLVGGQVESAIVAARGGFNLAICLIVPESQNES